MGTVWERLTSSQRSQSRSTESHSESHSSPIQGGDRHGVQLYADFQDCLDEHKGGAFLGEP